MFVSRFLTAAAALSAVLFATPCLAVDGTPDPGFGTDGMAFIAPDDVEARELQPNATVVLPDGKLLFGGSRSKYNPAVPFEPEYRAMFARLNSDGSVDTSFGNTSIPGVVVLPNLVSGARLEGIESMQRLDDGSVVAVGVSHVNAPLNGFVVKVDETGTLDASFGTGGIALFPSTYLHAVAIDSQGRIVAAGEKIANQVYTSTVIRLAADGSPDASFADAGTASIDWDGAGNSGYLADLVLLPDDGMIVGGAYSSYGDGLGNDFAIARLDASGALDPAFNGTGWRVFHDPTDDSFVNGIDRIVLTPDNAIAFAGYYYLPNDSITALVLGRLGLDGATDESFGDAATPGYLKPPMPLGAQSAAALGFAAQSDGKLVVGLSYFSGSEKEDFVAMRSTATGQLDPDFADAGVFDLDLAPNGVYSDISTLGIQPDGMIILAGRSLLDSSSPIVDLAAVRLLNATEPSDRIFADGFDP